MYLERLKKESLCVDKTNLLVALCRSKGIPARYLIMKCDINNKYKEGLDTIMHTSPEIKVNGEWMVADPAFGEETSVVVEAAEFGKVLWKKVHKEKGLNLYLDIYPFSSTTFSTEPVTIYHYPDYTTYSGLISFTPIES